MTCFVFVLILFDSSSSTITSASTKASRCCEDEQRCAFVSGQEGVTMNKANRAKVMSAWAGCLQSLTSCQSLMDL